MKLYNNNDKSVSVKSPDFFQGNNTIRKKKNKFKAINDVQNKIIFETYSMLELPKKISLTEISYLTFTFLLTNNLNPFSLS